MNIYKNEDIYELPKKQEENEVDPEPIDVSFAEFNQRIFCF